MNLFLKKNLCKKSICRVVKNGLTFLYISSNGFNYLWNGIKFLLNYLPKKLILVNRSGSKLFGVIIPFIVEMALVSDAITNSDRI